MRTSGDQGDYTYMELAMIKRILSPVAGLGTFLVIRTEAAERAIEVRPKTNEAIRKARRSLPGIGGMPLSFKRKLKPKKYSKGCIRKRCLRRLKTSSVDHSCFQPMNAIIFYSSKS